MPRDDSERETLCEFSPMLHLGVIVLVVTSWLYFYVPETSFLSVFAVTTLGNIAYTVVNTWAGLFCAPRTASGLSLGLVQFESFTDGPLLSSRNRFLNGVAHGLFFSWHLALLGGFFMALVCFAGTAPPLSLHRVYKPLATMYAVIYATTLAETWNCQTVGRLIERRNLLTYFGLVVGHILVALWLIGVRATLW